MEITYCGCVDCDSCDHRSEDCLCDISTNEEDCPLANNDEFKIERMIK